MSGFEDRFNNRRVPPAHEPPRSLVERMVLALVIFGTIAIDIGVGASVLHELSIAKQEMKK